MNSVVRTPQSVSESRSRLVKIVADLDTLLYIAAIGRHKEIVMPDPLVIQISNVASDLTRRNT